MSSGTEVRKLRPESRSGPPQRGNRQIGCSSPKRCPLSSRLHCERHVSRRLQAEDSPGSDHTPVWRVVNDKRLDLTLEDIEAFGIDVAVQRDKLARRHARAEENGVILVG